MVFKVTVPHSLSILFVLGKAHCNTDHKVPKCTGGPLSRQLSMLHCILKFPLMCVCGGGGEQGLLTLFKQASGKVLFRLFLVVGQQGTLTPSGALSSMPQVLQHKQAVLYPLDGGDWTSRSSPQSLVEYFCKISLS